MHLDSAIDSDVAHDSQPAGETINVMTLGGLALAVGILVDDATVEIENTHRNMAMRKPLVRAVLDGAQQIAAPAFVSTLAICIVFVPVLLLTGAAKYLFYTAGNGGGVRHDGVVFSFAHADSNHGALHAAAGSQALRARATREGGTGLIWRAHHMFNRRFELMRASYASLLHWCLDHRALVLIGFTVFVAGSLCLAPFVGRDFSDGRFRPDAAACPDAGGDASKPRSSLRGQKRDSPGGAGARGENIIDNIGIPKRRFQPGLRR